MSLVGASWSDQHGVTHALETFTSSRGHTSYDPLCFDADRQILVFRDLDVPARVVTCIACSARLQREG